MYGLVTLTSTILEIFIERLLKAMHAWLYMYIKHEYTSNYGCKCVALKHKPFRDSICHKSCMIGQFSLCLTYSQVLHQPYTEAQLIFFLPITKIIISMLVMLPYLGQGLIIVQVGEQQ